MLSENEKQLTEAIKAGNEEAFELLFKGYYKPLVAYAFRFLNDLASAESVVQDVFLKFWQKREELYITSSLKSYLFRSVKNYCINRLEHNKIVSGYQKMVIEREYTRIDYGEFFIEVGLMEKINQAINELPEKRQHIFRLAREEGLKYKEIAHKLNISIKTVETQMGLALKQLRISLKDYHSLVMFFMQSHQKNQSLKGN